MVTNQEPMHACFLVPPFPLVIIVCHWCKEGEEYSIHSFKVAGYFQGKWLVLS